MREVIELTAELLVEVFCTTIAFLAIFAIAVGAEWAMTEIGRHFSSDIAQVARYIKYALFFVDMALYAGMMYIVVRKHWRDWREHFSQK